MSLNSKSREFLGVKENIKKLENDKKLTSISTEKLLFKELIEKERLRVKEEKSKQIEAERIKRKEKEEAKKKTVYNIDFLKDRKQIKVKRKNQKAKSQEEEKKLIEIKLKKEDEKLKKEAEKRAAKINELNEKKRKEEEEKRFARKFSLELADRSVLISQRVGLLESTKIIHKDKNN